MVSSVRRSNEAVRDHIDYMFLVIANYEKRKKKSLIRDHQEYWLRQRGQA